MDSEYQKPAPGATEEELRCWCKTAQLELVTPQGIVKLFGKTLVNIRKAKARGKIFARFEMNTATSQKIPLFSLDSLATHWGSPDGILLRKMRANSHLLAVDSRLTYAILHDTMPMLSLSEATV